jgi:MoaA/NifB/PqqE/SkfB family radical SAM enzyme
MSFDTGKAIKVLGKWSLNRMAGRRLPLVAVFSMTHYCNFMCPMCPFGDSNKEGQIKFASKHDMNTDQWKIAMEKAAKFCIWSIMEGGEPTSRKDFMELLQHLKKIRPPVTVVTNGSFLHTFDMNVLKENIDNLCVSVDSIHKDLYCRIRGVPPEQYHRVIDNLHAVADHRINRYVNAVITKWNADEFISGEYFDHMYKEFGIPTITPTLVEDRVGGLGFETLSPDPETIRKVAQGILNYSKTHDKPFIGVPSLYWKQILDSGGPTFKECGVWKSLTIQADGMVRVPCWKLAVPTQNYNILEHDVDEIWGMPEWENLKGCHDCEHLTCVWVASQSVTTIFDQSRKAMANTFT